MSYDPRKPTILDVKALAKYLHRELKAIAIEIRRVLSLLPSDDIWHEIGASGEPAFATNWSNNTNNTAAFRFRDGKVVEFKGDLISTVGTLPQTMFTLPAAYQPSQMAILMGSSANLWATIHVQTNGNVDVINGTPNANISIDGLQFAL